MGKLVFHLLSAESLILLIIRVQFLFKDLSRFYFNFSTNSHIVQDIVNLIASQGLI
jgi:hypothetical protein